MGHPVKSDEHYCTVGVVDDDIGAYAVKHLAEIDKGKKPEEYGREIG